VTGVLTSCGAATARVRVATATATAKPGAANARGKRANSGNKRRMACRGGIAWRANARAWRAAGAHHASPALHARHTTQRAKKRAAKYVERTGG